MSGWTEFTGRRVLAVDDSRAVRLFLQDMLTRHGAVVEPASTGGEALERLARGEAYDVVLLDLNLPDIDGLEVLDAIRAADAEVPVVMITSAGGLHSATQAVRRGADGYVEKQHLDGGDDAPFLYALLQAVEHRAGIVARQQLHDTRADFYSMVTHDLRNPAGNVLSIVKLLTSGKAGPLTQRQEQLLAIAATSAGRLMDLINDYLDYATIDAGYLRLDRRDVDLRKVVHDAAHQAGPQAGLRQITISLDLPRQPVCAHVDAERLSQVLDNLVSNAVKYTQEGGWILLSLAEEEGCAVLRVRDTGIGIAPDEAPRLFARFQRVPGESTRGIRGTGLGLLIVKEIAEAHGGSVQVHSAGLGKGTTFTVRVPLQPPDPAESAVREDAEAGAEAGARARLMRETLAARLRAAFADDVEEQLRSMNGALLAMERDPSASAAHVAALFRAAHTLKGAARVAGLPTAERLCHAMEDVLAAARGGALVLTHGHAALLRSAADALAATAHRLRSGADPDASALDTIAGALAEAELHDLPHASADPGVRDRPVANDVSPVSFTLSERAREHAPQVRTRMFADACEALPRVVADAAEACGKLARAEIRGAEIPIDGATAAALREALMHLARNAVGHGIEPPEARERAGKPPVGTVAVAASIDAGTLRVTVADDGGGLDLAALRGVMGDDGDVAELLFHPGVTTQPFATALSGRGVGLDAVRAAMHRIGGTVSVDSEPGRGTIFTLECPINGAG